MDWDDNDRVGRERERRVESKTFFLVLALLFFCWSCGPSSIGVDENNNSSGDELSQNISAVDDPKIESHIAFDVLGGVFRAPSDDSKTIAFDSETNSQNPKDAVAKTSVNFSPSVIDSSYLFSGKGGHGRLIISLEGSASDANPPAIVADTKETIRHYSPLNIRFLFFKYAFENRCLGTVYLHGEIHCEVEGDYTLHQQIFRGTAHCFHGPKEESKPILYITDHHNYEVELNAHLAIDGNPFVYQSYTYEGVILIDGKQRIIEGLVAESGSCS